MSALSAGKKKSVDVALTLTQQLITLSSALIPVSVAIIGLKFPQGKVVPAGVVDWLVGAMLAYLSSIVCGLLVHSGMVAHLRTTTAFDIVYEKSVVIPAVLQWFTFSLAVILMVWALRLALI